MQYVFRFPIYLGEQGVDLLRIFVDKNDCYNEEDDCEAK